MLAVKRNRGEDHLGPASNKLGWIERLVTSKDRQEPGEEILEIIFR
jgi:hypothetical protein